MKHTYRITTRCGTAGAAALLLSACSTVADGTWQGARPQDTPYDTVLVVGAIQYERMRRDLEHQLVRGIETGKTRAIASWDFDDGRDRKQRSADQLQHMIRSSGADALLVTRIVGEHIKAGESQGKTYVNVGPQIDVAAYPEMTAVYAGDYSVHETDAHLVADTDTRMEALVYDIADHGRLVYRIETETKYEENGGDETYVVADKTAETVTKKLRAAGLTR